jgi:hypothetical protein
MRAGHRAGVARRLVVGGVLLAGVVAGCVAPPAASPSDASAPSVTIAPIPSTPPAAATTDPPTPTPAPAGTARPGIEVPPLADLAVDGGDPVAGQLGTYIWGSGGSDSPWLPGAPIRAATGEVLTVSLEPDLRVSGWSALLAPAAAGDGTGATPVGAGAGPLDVTAPGSGTWTLAVTIDVGDRGTATWFWRLEVP